MRVSHLCPATAALNAGKPHHCREHEAMPVQMQIIAMLTCIVTCFVSDWQCCHLQHGVHACRVHVSKRIADWWHVPA